MEAKAQERYSAIRHLPANTIDGSKVNLLMNAGLMADLPSLDSSGPRALGFSNRITISYSKPNAKKVRTKRNVQKGHGRSWRKNSGFQVLGY